MANVKEAESLLPRGPFYPLSLEQEALFVSHRAADGLGMNMVTALNLLGNIDVNALVKAVEWALASV